jgi:hypothetical protein
LSSSSSSDARSNNQNWGRDKEEKQTTLLGAVPEGKKRKFILVDDQMRGTRVRVHVELNKVKMDEMPDFHLEKNSVFPRQFYPRQMSSPSSSPNHPEDWNGVESFAQQDNYASLNVEDLIQVPLLDGSKTELSVPQVPRNIQTKEYALNELGYRMSWRQAKTFNERTIFMQKSRESKVVVIRLEVED